MRSCLTIIIMVLILASLAGAEIQDRKFLRWLRSKPPISEIVIEGQKVLTAEQILERMYSHKRTLWSKLKGDRRTKVQRESLGRDTLEIKYLYLTQGFIGVKIDYQYELIPNDSSARIKITIDEGRQFLYGEKHFKGEYDKQQYQPCYGIGQKLKTGDMFNLLHVRQATFEMKTVFANNGYPYAMVNFRVDSSLTSDTCDVTFFIYSDSLVHFGEIRAEGSRYYPEYTVRRESKMKEGEVYSRQSILDTQRRLVESGYFRTMNIARTDTSGSRLTPGFTLKVRERKPRYLTVTTGAGQSQVRDLEWDVSTRFGLRNLLGSRKLDLSTVLKFGKDKRMHLLEHDYAVRLTEPWLFGLRMPLVLAWQWEPGVKDPERDFRIETWSLSASTIKKYGDVYRLDFGVEYESVKIYGVPEDEVQSLKDEQEISVRRKIYTRFRRDSRDHIFIPHRGSLTDIVAEYYGGSMGGDNHFTKLEASWASFQPVWPGWISATRLKFGWVQEFGQSDNVPINDRYYLGGANSVRGFRVNTLGPVDSLGNLEKANFIVLFNQEFRWRTFQILRQIPFFKGNIGKWPLWQSLFFDVGNGYRSTTDVRFDNLAMSYGTGFQIVSPAGPVRIDYARRIKTDTIDYDSRWHITILYAF